MIEKNLHGLDIINSPSEITYAMMLAETGEEN